MRPNVSLLLLISWTFLCVTGETTTPASLETWTYTCQSKLARCPVGFEIAVDELYMTAERNCPTGSPVLGSCHEHMSAIILSMQKALCNGRRICNIIDVSGYLTECGISTFGIIFYRCNFVGYPLFTETTPFPTTTEPTPMPVSSTYCEPANLTCPKGKVVNVLEVQIAAKTAPCQQTPAGCCAHDVTDCVEPASSALLDIQRNICLNKAACSSIDLTGYLMFCNGVQYFSSYGIVRYSCYEGPTTPTTTKMPTTTTPKTETPTTRTQATKTPTTKTTTKTPTTKTPTITPTTRTKSTETPTTRTQASKAPATKTTTTKTMTTNPPTTKRLSTTSIQTTTTTLTSKIPTLPTVTPRKATPVSTLDHVLNFTSSPTPQPTTAHIVVSLLTGGSPLGLLGTILIKSGG